MSKLAEEYKRVAMVNNFVLVRARKHMVFKHASGPIVVCPATPSDSYRGLKEFRKSIRRALGKIKSKELI